MANGFLWLVFRKYTGPGLGALRNKRASKKRRRSLSPPRSLSFPHHRFSILTTLYLLSGLRCILNPRLDLLGPATTEDPA